MISALLLALFVQDSFDESTLRQLEKEIAAVRGLEFKTPVKAERIPRPKNVPKGIQAYYSTKDKKLYLYDDIRDNYRKGVLIHEMVHALQDQHFGLARLHQKSFGSDGELASAALIEGDATLTMIELLKKEQPRVEAMLDAPLEKSRDLKRAFLYAQGARYVRALKARAGWRMVNFTYRNPPRSTAQVLHPEGLKIVNLGQGRTRGEYALIEMLASHPKSAGDSVRAAAGWKGDGFREVGDSTCWTIVFSTGKDALEFQQAATTLHEARNPHLRRFLDEPGAAAWLGAKENVIAVLARGDRAFVIRSPDAEEFARTLDLAGNEILSLRVWSAREKRFLGFGEMVDQLMDYEAVCVGESHDNELHHRIQLQVIKALFARDESLGVGMEMFQRPFQNSIDRYFRGDASEDEFLKSSEYAKRWGFDWSLYRPIVEFSRRNGIPLAALNAPRELIARVSRVGFDGLNAREKRQLPEVDLQVPKHRDHWYERLARMHGRRSPTAEQKERSYQVMTLWDEFMADSAADFIQDRKLRRMVIVAGSGHIDRRFGIPDRAQKRLSGRVATIRIVAQSQEKDALRNPLADYVVITR